MNVIYLFQYLVYYFYIYLDVFNFNNYGPIYLFI